MAAYRLSHATGRFLIGWNETLGTALEVPRCSKEAAVHASKWKVGLDRVRWTEIQTGLVLPSQRYYHSHVPYDVPSLGLISS